MFGLFGKSKPYKVLDKVWISKAAKYAACAKMLQVNPDSLFITWFDETRDELKALLSGTAPVYKADQLGTISAQGRMLMFAEHHPLLAKEEMVFETLGLKEIPVLSGLDEPIFRKFGGERLIDIMRKLGVDENEVLGHSMITKSIERAQRKLQEKVITEQSAKSQEEWFALNFGMSHE